MFFFAHTKKKERKMKKDMLERIIVCDKNEMNLEKITTILVKCGYDLQETCGTDIILQSNNEEKIPKHLLQVIEVLEHNRQLQIDNGYLSVDFKQYQVQKEGKDIHLTPTEFKIFAMLVQSPNRIYSREQIIAYALDNQFEGYDRSIDTYIKSIRKKIEPDCKKPRYIRTVHGIGYKFTI